MQPIELYATVDQNGRLTTDTPVPALLNQRVKILIFPLISEEISETEWLKSISSNPAFAFLHEPSENIYSANDGKPFDDKG